MTSIFETVGFSADRVRFSPFVDNMLCCVASSSRGDSGASALSCLQSEACATGDSHRGERVDLSSLCSEREEKPLSGTGKRIPINRASFNDHQSSLPLIPGAHPSCTLVNTVASSCTGSGCLYILDHFVEDIANPLKCFRSFYWPLGALIDATWLNENYLWSVSKDASIQVWSLSSYLPVEDALSDLEPSPDPVQVISHAHSQVINSIDCNLMPSESPSILTASADSTVKLWDASTASLLKSFHLNPPHVNYSMSPFNVHHKSQSASNAHLTSLSNAHGASHLLASRALVADDHHRRHSYASSGEQHHHRTSHVNTFASQETQQMQHSSALLQLLENSQYLQPDVESQGNINLFTSSASVSSSPSSSSTLDSVIHSPSSPFSSYPNTPPSVNGQQNTENTLCHELMQSSVSPLLQSNHLKSCECNRVDKSLSSVHVTCVSWCPLISSTFASTCDDGTVHIWSTKADDGPNLTFKIDSNHLTCCDWNKYNEYQVAISSRSGSISLWDIRSANGGPITVINGHKKPVSQVKFSPHSPYRLASVSSDGTSKIWNVSSGCFSYIDESNTKKSNNSRLVTHESMTHSLLHTHRHHSDHVCGFDFNPSIRDRVVDCGRDSLVCLYSLVTPPFNRLSLKPTDPSVNLRPSISRPSHSDLSSPYSIFSTVS